MIHDCLGHVPPLMKSQDYAELLALIGKGRPRPRPHGDQGTPRLKRFSWFSIEFGLIEEDSETKVFGAGILSSTGEIPNSLFSKDATRRSRFVTETVITTDYDSVVHAEGLLHRPVAAVPARRHWKLARAAVRNPGTVRRQEKNFSRKKAQKAQKAPGRLV